MSHLGKNRLLGRGSRSGLERATVVFPDCGRATMLVLLYFALSVLLIGCYEEETPSHTVEVTAVPTGEVKVQTPTPQTPTVGLKPSVEEESSPPPPTNRPIAASESIEPVSPARSTEPRSKAPRILDMSAINDAVGSGDISDVDALMYQVFAQFGVLKTTSKFMKPVSGEEETSSLSHAAFTRLLMQADSLPEPYIEVLRRLMPNDSNLKARARIGRSAKLAHVLPISTPPWAEDLIDGSSSEWPQHNSCTEAFYSVAWNHGELLFCFPWLQPEPFDPSVSQYSNNEMLTIEQMTRANEIRSLLDRVTPDFEQVLGLQGWTSNLYIQMHEDTTITFPALTIPGQTSGTFLYGFAYENAPWEGNYMTTEGAAPETGYCHIWIFGDPTGEWQSTVVHELFHCLQMFKKIYHPDWLLEGTATWAEHHVHHHYQPGRPHWDHFRRTIKWVTWFNKDFADREYDVLFPLLHADAQHIGALLSASCCLQDALTALPTLSPNDFPTFWHKISVAGFNQKPPVDKLKDNGAEHGFTPRNGLLDMQPVALNKGMEDSFLLSVAPYSKRLYLFEFQEDAKPELSRVQFDLSEVPEPFRITALTKVNGEWEDRQIDLHQQTEYVFCRLKVGLCADAVESDELDEGEIKNYETIAFVITNVTGAEKSLKLRFHTYNPHLHGQWIRTQMIVDIGDPPFVVVNTKLSFDESVPGTSDDWMKEETGNYQLEPGSSEWGCNYGGSYRAYMRSAISDTWSPDYEYRDWKPTEAYDKTNAVGLVRYIPGQGQGLTPWRNTCTYTPPGYDPSTTSTLHVPLTSSPDLSVRFKIYEDDTLVIDLPYRTFVYQRTSHDP